MKQYLIYAGIIALFLAACFGREYGHKHQVERLEHQIVLLQTTIDSQKETIVETASRLDAKTTELEAVGKLCAAIEEADQTAQTAKEAIYETVQTDAASASWMDDAVPDSILDILHGILCNAQSDRRNTD